MYKTSSHGKPYYRPLCKECRNAALRNGRGLNNGRGFCKEKWKPLRQRFEDRLNKGVSCWEWLGSKNKNGYGTMKIDSKMYFSHRLSYEIYNNTKIPDGMLVCHKCDNPSCVNPEHLFIGTHKDNFDDMCNKGRQKIIAPPPKRGEDSPNSKINEETVRSIRGYEGTFADNARKHGISKSQIVRIVKRESWKHVD